jgi:HSP20 family molecular chaperone IbpA
MEVADMIHAKRRLRRSASMPSGTEKEKPSTSVHPFMRSSFGDDPSVSAWVGAKAMIVTAEIPGAEAGNVEVSVDGRQLILKKKGNGQGTSADHGHKRQSVELEKIIDLPYRVDRSELEVHCDRGFVNVILKKEDEQTLYNRTVLEATIINTVSRYFNGHGTETTHSRKKEEQFLIQALQRYFKGSTGASEAG